MLSAQGDKGNGSKAAADAGTKGQTIDAVTGATPRYNWIAKNTAYGETIYYDKGSGKYRYNNDIYNTEAEARKARDAAIKKKKDENKEYRPNAQQNHSTTGTLTQIKWT